MRVANDADPQATVVNERRRRRRVELNHVRENAESTLLFDLSHGVLGGNSAQPEHTASSFPTTTHQTTPQMRPLITKHHTP